MKFPQTCEVEMLAFGQPDEVRVVDLSYITPPSDIKEYLSEVFHWGQNDFQPQKHPSVSGGDVIRLESEHYLVASFGFKKLTFAEYENYVSTPQVDRLSFRWVHLETV